jgi:mannose-6-phosphate isomerase-like protein (cupin superfamily)
MEIARLAEAEPFTTADGSQIRELLNPRNSALQNQSIAEATLAPGAATTEHFHPRAEEVYHILRGRARIHIEGKERVLQAGDAVAIPNGQRHKIWNIGAEPLVFLCCCAPAYTHDDTVLVAATI